MAGIILRNLVKWGNFSLGMSRCFLEDVHTPLPHLELKWLGSLRQYLQSNDLWLTLDSSGIPPLERVHDGYIMDRILSSKTFTPAQIRCLNYCRLFLNAITLSDVSTVAGSRLDPDKLGGYSSLLSTTSRWMQIHQDRPSELEWQLWKKANKIWSDPAGTLFQPLGQWTQSHSKRRIQCIAYQYDSTLAVQTEGDQYIKCRQHHGRDYRDNQNCSLHYDDIPEHANPVLVILHKDTTWRVTHATQSLRTPTPFTYGTFAEFIATLEPWEIDLLQHHELQVDPYILCLEIQPQFFAGSNWSEKYGVQGAFGWSISTAYGDRVGNGMGPARGRRMDSYRAECTGVLSLLRFLIRVSQFTAMHEVMHGVIGTDSQSLLDKLMSRQDQGLGKSNPVQLDELTSEWDLLIEIQQGLQLLPGVSIICVRGHQDNKTTYDRLPLLAQLNVDADKLAGRFQNQQGTTLPFVLLSPRTGVNLEHRSGTITSKYEDTIRYLATGPVLQHQIKKKYAWSDSTMRSIHWQAHGRVFRNHMTSKVHISKLVHDCLPTHSLINKFDSGHRKCPTCGNIDETRNHIIQCLHPERHKWRKSWWRELSSFHQTANTSPSLKYVFRKAITQWVDNQDSDIVNPNLFPTETRRLIHQQNHIEWHQIFNGRFSKEWTRLQDEYYYRHRNHTRYRRTGLQWQQTLITLIWKQWRKLWAMRNGDVHGHTLRAQKK